MFMEIAIHSAAKWWSLLGCLYDRQYLEFEFVLHLFFSSIELVLWDVASLQAFTWTNKDLGLNKVQWDMNVNGKQPFQETAFQNEMVLVVCHSMDYICRLVWNKAILQKAWF